MILERFRLDGRVAVVTGATSELGVAIARALGAAGRVFGSSRDRLERAAILYPLGPD
jgi:NAD(P)-dependent dehydrogenase (short-subunit alcohol dehydrogenase family)